MTYLIFGCGEVKQYMLPDFQVNITSLNHKSLELPKAGVSSTILHEGNEA